MFLVTAHVVLSNFTTKQATQTADQLTNIARTQLSEHFAASLQSGQAATHSMKSGALSDRDIIRKSCGASVSPFLKLRSAAFMSQKAPPS